MIKIRHFVPVICFILSINTIEVENGRCFSKFQNKTLTTDFVCCTVKGNCEHSSSQSMMNSGWLEKRSTIGDSVSYLKVLIPSVAP